MKEPTHIDLSFVAAGLAGWPGDQKLLARQAAYPDQVCTLKVDGVGYHIFGMNLESLKHFGKMVLRGGEGFVPVGYNWKRDPSIPHINLPDHEVESHPDGWGPPIGGLMAANEPLAILLRNLKGHATIAADAITYPAASTMAAWCETVIQTLPPDITPVARQEAKDRVAGWALHFIQDLCIPHHAGCMLGTGHATYEAELAEEWQSMRSAGCVPEPESGWKPCGTLRELAEACSRRSFVVRSRLGWYRWIWRRGWHRLIRESIVRGLTASVAALKFLQDR